MVGGGARINRLATALCLFDEPLSITLALG